mgnify:CR=1 FL=1
MAAVGYDLYCKMLNEAVSRLKGEKEEADYNTTIDLNIDAFIPEEYWTLDANLKVKGERKLLTAKFYGTEKNKMTISSKEELDAIVKEVENADYSVADIKKGERTKKAPVPFTTSTLQQEASKALNFATAKTMRIAQQLYEGVDIKGSGTVGLITYLLDFVPCSLWG